MHITINNENIELPSESMTIREVLQWRHVPEVGTAVAVNDKLLVRTKWDLVRPVDGDRLTIISAAYGG